ncbi:MAG TPA: hypothetical protein DEG17_10855 [Cyanobacteria bacterium UBA11149]|nr:hypothetical protein [Cyanobacteria bacterium UBA11367]HBE57273.1 hypothetical protein [Cyanobacteria bacterium UBA11366]HBK66188.1 hypothetical protein [Cyanobacteria bacterium UBA11166]HBR75318.1 hypothetical protein [Cyanobacteria bacterium UBA11159]HBS70299.1 hypothetical protein [Cyanobacteria bacterium UBA11153]HBW89347.1 hypothetical protein [Cyanobacteria bacterium UBA11149]HCA97536.1 hypothetical protein [Cyanobacteria bacterium UBA9226]
MTAQLSIGLFLIGTTLIWMTKQEIKHKINPGDVKLRNTQINVVYQIIPDRPQKIDFVLKNSSKVIYTLEAGVPNDLGCSEIFLTIFDIDGDGYDDIYYNGCDAIGFLKYDPNSGKIQDIDIGDVEPPNLTGLKNPWFRLIKPKYTARNKIISGPGAPVTIFGAGLVLFGSLGLVIYLVNQVRKIISVTKHDQ